MTAARERQRATGWLPTTAAIFAFNVPFKGSLPCVRRPYSAAVRAASDAHARADRANDGYYILGVERQRLRVRLGAKYFGVGAAASNAVDLMQLP